jgi:hypothetical protein
MTRAEPIDKLIAVRHYCFVRGVLGNRSTKCGEDRAPEEDFRRAFRTVNRLYVQLRDNIAPESMRKGWKRPKAAA